MSNKKILLAIILAFFPSLYKLKIDAIINNNVITEVIILNRILNTQNKVTNIIKEIILLSILFGLYVKRLSIYANIITITDIKYSAKLMNKSCRVEYDKIFIPKREYQIVALIIEQTKSKLKIHVLFLEKYWNDFLINTSALNMISLLYFIYDLYL
jgi:hypothetical protein